MKTPEQKKADALAATRAWRARNKEKSKADQRALYQANREDRLAKQKARRLANLEEVRARDRAYYAANREIHLEKQKRFYAENREQILARQARWKEANREHVNTYAQTYRRLNRAKVYDYMFHYRRRPKALFFRQLYIERFMANNLEYRLSCGLRTRLHAAIKKDVKRGSAVRDLGCTIPEFKSHLEKRFLPGMSWDNWSPTGWHIDHIKPLASFDLSDREQFLQATHFTNMQPLWAVDNLKKGASVAA